MYFKQYRQQHVSAVLITIIGGTEENKNVDIQQQIMVNDLKIYNVFLHKRSFS